MSCAAPGCAAVDAPWQAKIILPPAGMFVLNGGFCLQHAKLSAAQILARADLWAEVVALFAAAKVDISGRDKASVEWTKKKPVAAAGE